MNFRSISYNHGTDRVDVNYPSNELFLASLTLFKIPEQRQTLQKLKHASLGMKLILKLFECMILVP